MTKTIYLTDPETGLLLGESVHPVDPVESARTGETVYALLNPGYATELVPPVASAGMQARLVDGAWLLEDLPPPPEGAPAAIASLMSAFPEEGEPEPPTMEERIAALERAAMSYLDAMARARGWADIGEAMERATHEDLDQAEGQAYVVFHDATWAKFHELVALWQQGEISVLTEQRMMALLPRLVLSQPQPQAPPLPALPPVESPEASS